MTMCLDDGRELTIGIKDMSFLKTSMLHKCIYNATYFIDECEGYKTSQGVHLTFLSPILPLTVEILTQTSSEIM